MSAVEFELGGPVIFCAGALPRADWFCCRSQSCLLVVVGEDRQGGVLLGTFAVVSDRLNQVPGDREGA